MSYQCMSFGEDIQYMLFGDMVCLGLLSCCDWFYLVVLSLSEVCTNILDII